MPSLSELQRRFAEGLLAPGGAPTAILAAGAAGGERLCIYRRTIASNYRNALGATYPVVRRVVGASFFDAAVDACVTAHPSRSGDLNEYGGAFGDFLAGYPPAAELRYLPDVARLEWAIDAANRAADSRADPDVVLGALAACPAEQLPSLHLQLDPSCRLVESAFPLLRIWQVNQPGYEGDLRVDFAAEADRLRIRREQDGVALERVAAGEFAWLSALFGGAQLAMAIEEAQRADTSFNLGSALHRFIGDGTIVGIEELP